MPKTNILDNIEKIRKVDKSDMLSFCVNAPKHYEEAAKIARKFLIGYSKPQKIIVAGMGGSGIGGELLKDWARGIALVPIEVVREYSLPVYADKNTLVFVVSYSGETEETLSVFVEAIKKGCMIVCISSGGKLLEYAEKLNLPHIRIPSGMPPRAALPYFFMPLLIVLEKIGLVSNVNMEVSEAVNILKKVSNENSPEKLSSINFSKTLALNVNGTVPVVYGFGFYQAVAQRFKQQFNENSKIPSKWEFLPELNHNEIVGWEKAGKMAKNFSAIFIRDGEEPKEIRNRIEATKELMLGKKVKVFEVWSMGESRLAKMLSTICIGDFTSVYLALLRKVDPTPVKTIAMLKEKIKQSGAKEKILRELQKLVEK
ncbi:MAG: bifunctional phosphoglucose/phosphomannose isomerase [Candidatus Bathycorpusculaceae bacterium]